MKHSHSFENYNLKYQLPSKAQSAVASKALGPCIDNTLKMFYTSTSTCASFQGNKKEEQGNRFLIDSNLPSFDFGFDSILDNSDFEFEISDNVLADISMPSNPSSSSTQLGFDIIPDNTLPNTSMPSDSSSFSSSFDFDIPDEVLANITFPTTSNPASNSLYNVVGEAFFSNCTINFISK